MEIIIVFTVFIHLEQKIKSKCIKMSAKTMIIVTYKNITKDKNTLK